MNIAARKRAKNELREARQAEFAQWLAPILGLGVDTIDNLIEQWVFSDANLPAKTDLDPVVTHNEIMYDLSQLTPKISNSKLEKIDGIVQVALGLKVAEFADEL